jgi:MFS family permease
MAGLFRLVGNDFRVVRYANAALLSAMAASMLWLSRRLRGSSRATDAVLPLSILNIAQAECLINGFAMNLILSSLIAIALIVATGLARGGGGRVLALIVGLSLVLLPLSGGSGLAMLPPLALWLAGYVAWGWWSGKKPGVWTRAVGLGLLLAGSTVVVLYLRDYTRPSYHPLPHSMASAASSTLMYLSLAVFPQISLFWWPAGLIVVAILTATLVLLAIASLRSPDERPRALGLFAIILAMLCVAAAVAVSRAALGGDRIMSSRYITLTTPLLCVVYVAWLLYGKARPRLAMHLGLIVLMGLSIPNGRRFSHRYGTFVRDVDRRVERRLKDHAPTSSILKLVWPHFHSDRDLIVNSFKMLKAARVGAFAGFEDDRVATTPEAADTVRR